MTERQSTGETPLVKMIKEVYDTKIRMKEVLGTDIDDFEQYPVLAWNKLALRYNQGIQAGWNDGWHQFYPDHQVTRDEYEHLLFAYRDFTPSTPQYSAETDIANLVIVMKDNYRIRMELKEALRTESNEFVTYPDICEAGVDGWYEEAYYIAYQEAYNKAYDASIGVPIIVWKDGKITMYNGSTFENTTMYYWIDGQSVSRVVYTQPFTVSQTCTVYGAIEYQNRMGKIVTRYIDLDTDYGSEPLRIYLAEDNTTNDNTIIFTVDEWEFSSTEPWCEFWVKLNRNDGVNSYFHQIWDKGEGTKQFQITLGGTRRQIYVSGDQVDISIRSLNKNNGGKLNISGNPLVDYGTGGQRYVCDCQLRKINDCCIEDAQYLYAWGWNFIRNTNFFEGCNSLIYSPKVYANGQLGVNNSNMFNGCTSLNQIECYIYNVPHAVYTNWVNGVASIGVFIKNHGLDLPTGVNGIPVGWIVEEEQYEIDSSIIPPVITSGRNTVTITNSNDFGYIFYYTDSDSTEIAYTGAINITDDTVIYAFIKREEEDNVVSTTSTKAVYWSYLTINKFVDRVYINQDITGQIKYYIGNDSSNIYDYSDYITLESDNTITAWIEPHHPETFTVTINPALDPMYIRALESGNITMNFQYQYIPTGSGQIYYKKNNSAWTELISVNSNTGGTDATATGTLSLNSGDIVLFYNRNIAYWTESLFSSDIRYEVGGNIASMDCNGNGYNYINDLQSVTSASCSRLPLFRNDTKLVSSKNLIINYGSYSLYSACMNMFEGCTNMTQTFNSFDCKNVLTLNEMYKGCTSLTYGIINLTNEVGCESMYEGCTSLIKGSDIQYKVNYLFNYYRMYYDCPGLTEIKLLVCHKDSQTGNPDPTWIGYFERYDTGYSTIDGLINENTSRNGIFYKYSSQTWTNIPSGWTVVDA